MATKKIEGVSLETSGLNLAKSIYKSASATFQADVPEPTAENAAEFFKAVFTYQVTANEFAAALVNKIAFPWIRRARAYDPLTQNFVKGQISPGYTIEEIFADMLPVYDVDPCDDYIGEQFRRETPRLYTIYHSINFYKKARTTVNDWMLSRAFREWEELANLTSIFTSQLYESMRDAEYHTAKNLIDMGVAGGVLYPVAVPSITNASTAADIESLSVSLRETYLSLQFATREYNYMGANNRADADEIYIICTPTIRANMDIKNLANAFNLSLAEMYGHVVVIDKFDNPSVQCVMCTRDWLQIWTGQERTNSLYNPENNNINYTYLKDGIFSVSVFQPAVVFMAADSINTPTGVEVADGQSAAKCAFTRINAKLETADDSTGYLYNKIMYEVSGNTSKRTVMYPFGLLYVGPDEEATELTVTATSGQDANVTATGTVAVTAAVQ